MVGREVLLAVQETRGETLPAITVVSGTRQGDLSALSVHLDGMPRSVVVKCTTKMWDAPRVITAAVRVRIDALPIGLGDNAPSDAAEALRRAARGMAVRTTTPDARWLDADDAVSLHRVMGQDVRHVDVLLPLETQGDADAAEARLSIDGDMTLVVALSGASGRAAAAPTVGDLRAALAQDLVRSVSSRVRLALDETSNLPRRVLFPLPIASGGSIVVCDYLTDKEPLSETVARAAELMDGLVVDMDALDDCEARHGSPATRAASAAAAAATGGLLPSLDWRMGVTIVGVAVMAAQLASLALDAL